MEELLPSVVTEEDVKTEEEDLITEIKIEEEEMPPAMFTEDPLAITSQEITQKGVKRPASLSSSSPSETQSKKHQRNIDSLNQKITELVKEAEKPGVQGKPSMAITADAKGKILILVPSQDLKPGETRVIKQGGENRPAVKAGREGGLVSDASKKQEYIEQRLKKGETHAKQNPSEAAGPEKLIVSDPNLRTSALSLEQRRTLFNLIKDKKIILSRKHVPEEIIEKRKAWEQVTVAFNDTYPIEIPRTTVQLKRAWEYIKKKQTTASRGPGPRAPSARDTFIKEVQGLLSSQPDCPDSTVMEEPSVSVTPSSPAVVHVVQEEQAGILEGVGEEADPSECVSSACAEGAGQASPSLRVPEESTEEANPAGSGQNLSDLPSGSLTSQEAASCTAPRKMQAEAHRLKRGRRLPYAQRRLSHHQKLQASHLKTNEKILQNLTEKHEKEMAVLENICKMCKAVVEFIDSKKK